MYNYSTIIALVLRSKMLYIIHDMPSIFTDTHKPYCLQLCNAKIVELNWVLKLFMVPYINSPICTCIKYSYTAS